MKAATLIVLASTVSASILDARRYRDCTETETQTTTVTVTPVPSTTTKTVTVTAKPSTTTTTTTTTTPKASTTKTTTTSTKASTTKPTTKTTTTTTTTSTTKPTTTKTTTTTSKPFSTTTSKATTTKPATTTTKSAADPTATDCTEIGDGGIHTAPNGKIWHVQCGQHYTGSNSIIGFSDTVDSFAACMDYCTTVSGAHIVQYMERSCDCWAHGGTGIESLEGADAAYTYDDNTK